MSDSHLIANSLATPFLAEANELTGGMIVTVQIDGVIMQVRCVKFEVTDIKEVNFMDERRALLAAQNAAKSG